MLLIMNDQHLILGIKNNDQKAFKLVFKCFYEPLLAYVTTFTMDRQEAKDIVQNSFIILWEKRKKLSDDSSIKNYLFTVAHNLFINQHRKNQFKNKVFIELKSKALSNRINEEEITTLERIKKLLVLIDSLPPRCKEILLLNKREGLKYKEIANRLNISVKTVESQMRIAYQKIREGFKHNPLVLSIIINKLLSKI